MPGSASMSSKARGARGRSRIQHCGLMFFRKDMHIHEGQQSMCQGRAYKNIHKHV